MKIIDNYSKRLPIKLEKVIRKLLKVVPKEHLVGLNSIILLDLPQQKKFKDAQGLYWQRHELQPARIEISIDNIYGDHPFWVSLIPCIGKLLLAEVLFHEIGHHYRHFTHGVSKKENEDFAEDYKKKHVQKAFYLWLYFLRPFKPIINWLVRERPNHKNV